MANTRSKTNNKMIDNQSGTRIASSEDLISDILFRLPVTFILRFKSVTKHWRLLLTHRHFTNRYDNINFQNAPGLFARTHLTHPHNTLSKSLAHLAGDVYVPYGIENRNTARPFTSLDSYFNRSGVRIEQSCNGLLLCSVFHNGAHEYYVFNPTTKQLALIPSVRGEDGVGKSKSKSKSKNICSMALAFHQIYCVHYKVVCINAVEPGGDLIQIQVYSSDTRTWKICVESCAVSAQNPKFHDPVYWNGAVYWGSVYQNNLFYFKLDDEELRLLSIPSEMMSYETSVMYLGESGGHLHLIFDTDGEDHVLRVNVYEMLRDHSGWFVKYQLQLNELLRDFPCLISQYEHPGANGEMEHPYECDFKVVDVVRGKEEEEDTFLVLLTPGKMIWYNVHDKSFKELYRKNDYFIHVSGFHRHMETLFSF